MMIDFQGKGPVKTPALDPFIPGISHRYLFHVLPPVDNTFPYLCQSLYPGAVPNSKSAAAGIFRTVFRGFQFCPDGFCQRKNDRFGRGFEDLHIRHMGTGSAGTCFRWKLLLKKRPGGDSWQFYKSSLSD